MTRIKFSASESTIYGGFSTDGHSGYSEEGSDILCAAVSGATELVINILEQFSVDFNLEVDENIPHVGCEIKQCAENTKKSEFIKATIGGYFSYVKDLAESYPEYIEIITEV